MTTKKILNNEFFTNYLTKYLDENKDSDQIYNIKCSEMPFFIQYNQLIAYLKFRNELNKYISGWSLLHERENLTEILVNGQKAILSQQNYCLIDKNWIRKWRKHVGYEEIKNKFVKLKHNNNDIDDNNNYIWINEIIEKNSKDNLLSPLDNSGIYKNNEVVPDSDFELINEECYKLFIIGAEKKMDITNYRKLPVQFLPEKYIVIIDYKLFWIVFKQNILKIQFEIIVNFKEIGNRKRDIMNDFINKDINEWVKEIGFNLISDMEKEITIYDCKIIIVNKTLKFKKKEMNNNNIFSPNLLNKRTELLYLNKNITQNYID